MRDNSWGESGPVNPSKRIERLERMVLALHEICRQLWGGDGCWQECWDEINDDVAELKRELK